MKIGELIRWLQTYPPDLEVVYRLHSEQVLMEKDDIEVKELCEARPDGWVPSKRPDKPFKPYIVFPGN